MAKTRMKKTVKNVINNGLSEALSGQGFNPGSLGVQLSQWDTLFKNLRWYLVSNNRQLLSQAYAELGILQTLVDVPVDDGLRGGVDIKSKQLDESQVQELQVSMDRDNDLTIVGQALKWNRLYGGAGVLILTDQDSETELNVDAITADSPLEFRAVDMWELFWDKQNTESYDPELQNYDTEFYNYYAKKLHKTRVMKMKGITPPSFIRPRLRGWGMSIAETLVRSINQFLKSTDLTFEVLDEFKLDIYKLKNLNNTLLSPNGDNAIRTRVQLTNQTKSYQHAITMDSEDDYIQKQLSFTGLSEVMAGIRMQIASDMRMPLTKVFGISAAGFSSGEDDIENYNAMVEGQVRNKCKYDILRILELKCKKMFDFVPDDLEIAFKPLRILTSEQEENVKSQKFNRVMMAMDKGLMSVVEAKEALNKDNLLPNKLDTSVDVLNVNNPDVTKEPEVAKLESKSTTIAAKDAPLAKNSLAFEIASYEADGGDATMAPGREKLFMNPGNLSDEGLWKKAREASQSAFGKDNWAFVTWYYKKHGGKFK